MAQQVAGEGSLFLGRLDQGLVGNADTHVNRPEGKASFVPWDEAQRGELGENKRQRRTTKPRNGAQCRVKQWQREGDGAQQGDCQRTKKASPADEREKERSDLGAVRHLHRADS